MDRFPGGKSRSRGSAAERARWQKAVLRIATENARDERTRGVRTEDDVRVAEQFLSRASLDSRGAAERITREALRRQKVEKAVGTRLYRKWENALERAIAQITKEILQAERGRKLVMMSEIQSRTITSTYQYKDIVGKITSELNKKLAGKIIEGLKNDSELTQAFRGRSGLLRRLFYNLKSQAARNKERIIGYSPPL